MPNTDLRPFRIMFLHSIDCFPDRRHSSRSGLPLQPARLKLTQLHTHCGFSFYLFNVKANVAAIIDSAREERGSVSRSRSEGHRLMRTCLLEQDCAGHRPAVRCSGWSVHRIAPVSYSLSVSFSAVLAVSAQIPRLLFATNSSKTRASSLLNSLRAAASATLNFSLLRN